MNRSIVISVAVLGPMVGGFLAPAPALGTDKYFCATTDNTWSGANWKVFGAGDDCTTGPSL